MRKIFVFALSLALFSGCFGQTEQPQEIIPQDPQAAFDSLSEQNRDSWKNTILEKIPEIEIFEKTKTEFVMNIQAFIQEMGGDINATITSEGVADYSNPESVKASSNVKIEASAKGDLFSGEVKAVLEMIIADASIFAQLKEVTVDIPNIPTSQIMDPIKPLIGKWYGDTFDTINESLGGELDLKELLVQSAQPAAEIRKKIGDIITENKLFIMQEKLDDENGFARFKVELDTEALKKAIVDLATISNPSEKVAAQMKDDLDKEMEGLKVVGTIGYLITEPKYFTFTGLATNDIDPQADNVEISISFQKAEKVFTVKGTEENTEHATLKITSANGVDSFQITGGESTEEEQTLIAGKSSDTSFEATLFDPEKNAEIAKLTLTKEGDVWSGKITNTEEPNIVISIDRLFYDSTSFSLGITVMDAEEKLGSGTIEYSLQEVSEVKVSAPEVYESFGTLMENFLPLMMMGSPGMNPGAVPSPGAFPTYDENMSDEEIEAMINEMMKNEGVIDGGMMDDPGMDLPPPPFPEDVMDDEGVGLMMEEGTSGDGETMDLMMEETVQ